MSGFFEGVLTPVFTGAGGIVGFLAGGGGGLVASAPTAGGAAVVTVPAGAYMGGAFGAGAGYAAGKGTGAWIDQTGPGQYVNESVEDFQEWLYGNEAADKIEEQSNARTDAASITCATCAQNPCAALACGKEGSPYKGGAHGCMTKPTGDEKDSHHMPADSKSPVHREAGPAIQMDPADHALTNSYKGKVKGTSYAAQRDLLANNQTMAALALDALDVKAIAAAQGQPGKYDDAIEQMTAYAICLKTHGIIQ